jgi:DNA repair protein RecO (recombination protein O)
MNALSDTAFILHSIAWRETSLIVEAFTRSHGRLGLIAKGARRPRSALRGLLQPFQPLEIRWAGKGELRTLISAEWVGGLPAPDGAAVMLGFYLNELMVRLLAREDAHPTLFDDYRETLGLLGDRSFAEPALRRFECNLLREMGYAPNFDRESTSGGAPVVSGHLYRVDPLSGIQPASDSEPGQEVIRGETLLALANAGKSMLALANAGKSIREAVASLQEPEIAAESKRLLRALLGYQLGDDVLASREVMRELARI